MRQVMKNQAAFIILAFVFTVVTVPLFSCDDSTKPEKAEDGSAMGGFEPLDDDDDNSYDKKPPPGIDQWRWQWVDGAVCRDGSPTGFGIRRSEVSDNIAIYLMAGGICVTPETCEQNPEFYDDALFYEIVGEDGWGGIFNPWVMENPFRDWNMIFVPCCTADLFLGNKPDAFVPGVSGQQQFVGFDNLKLFVPEIKAAFESSPEKIMLFGQCSGANGAMFAYPMLADVFENTPITFINDTGPIAEMDDALSPCLQRLLRAFFNINPAIPQDCVGCFGQNGDGLSNIQTYLPEKFPTGSFGLISSMADESIRYTWGFGINDCSEIFSGSLISESIFASSLIDLRDNYLLPTGKWSTYFIEGNFHTVGFETDELFSIQQEDDFLIDWVSQLLNGVPEPVGP